MTGIPRDDQPPNPPEVSLALTEAPVVARVLRSGTIESVHRGSVVVTGPDGADVAAGAEAPFEIIVPVDRLATRDSARRAWRPPTGQHTITVARFAGDPAATTIQLNPGNTAS